METRQQFDAKQVSSGRRNLQVTLENFSFAKEFHYFITVQLDGDGEKRRTDISAAAQNPIFSANMFYLPITELQIAEDPQLQFASFVVTDQSQTSQGSARLLGDSVISLGELMNQLTDVHGVGLRQQLSFFRTQKDQSKVVVGKFNVILKIVNDYLADEDASFDGANLTGPRRKQAEIHALPQEQALFKWRVRADLRQITNVPLLASGQQPSIYCELGWSLYDNSVPADSNKIFSLLCESTSYPDFNQQLLLHNPQEVKDTSGYIWLVVKDRARENIASGMPANNGIIGIYKMPLENLKPYQPLHMNWNLLVPGAQPASVTPDSGCSFKFSLTLEKPIQSAVDSLSYVVVNWANFVPLTGHVKKFALALTLATQGVRPALRKDFNLKDCEQVLSDENDEEQMKRIMEEHRLAGESVHISNWIRTAPDQVANLYDSLTYFTVPKSSLTQSRGGVAMYLLIKDEQEASMSSVPGEVVALLEPSSADFEHIGQELNEILYEPGHPQQTFKFRIIEEAKAVSALATPEGAFVDVSVDLSCHPQSLSADPSRDPNQPRPTSSEGLEKVGSVEHTIEDLKDREKWALLTRELAQKQEIVHRLMRENDDKTSSLKLATAEIVDLRRAMKLMQGEAQILRRKLGEQEAAELGNLVMKEIQGMSIEECQSKIVKLAQAYRSERLRNEEFSKALKSTNVDLTQAKTISAEYENLQHAYKEQSQKLALLAKENKKTTLYKDTVKKQEAVIGRLETLLEKLMRDKKQRESQRQQMPHYDQFENDQRFLSSEEEKLRLQVSKQEDIISDLRDQIAKIKGGYEGDLETVELEVNLKNAEARAEAASSQLQQQSLLHAREITQLKQQLLQKESIIETLQGRTAAFVNPYGQQFYQPTTNF